MNTVTIAPPIKQFDLDDIQAEIYVSMTFIDAAENYMGSIRKVLSASQGGPTVNTLMLKELNKASIILTEAYIRLQETEKAVGQIAERHEKAKRAA